MEVSIKGLIIGTILLIIMVGLLVSGFYQLEKQMEQKESEIFFNGTTQGATVIINQIRQTQSVPFFVEDGTVKYIPFEDLCLKLNYTKEVNKWK